jgi:hypothetical protein
MNIEIQNQNNAIKEQQTLYGLNVLIGFLVINGIYAIISLFLSVETPEQAFLVIDAILTIFLGFALYERINAARIIMLILSVLSCLGSFLVLVVGLPYCLLSGTQDISWLSVLIAIGSLTFDLWIIIYLRKNHVCEAFGVLINTETNTKAKPKVSYCQYCGKELRSPNAKQCPHCFMSWHDPDNPIKLDS